MTQPALARSGPLGRMYVWPPDADSSGEYEVAYPSVTTVLKELAKPALQAWAAREVATFAVTQKHAWLQLPEDSAIDLLKRSPYRSTSKAADRGSIVHAALEAWLAEHTGQGAAPDVPAELAGYVDAAVDYLDSQVDDVLEVEATVYSDTLQTAGTFDLLAVLKDGRTAVVDWKTGKRIYPETALQLVAYASAQWIGHADGTRRDLPPVDVGVAVRLAADGSWEAKEVAPTEALLTDFRALRRVLSWRQHREPASWTATTTRQAQKETQ